MVKTKYDLIEEKSFKNMPYWVSELAENNFQRNRSDHEIAKRHWQAIPQGSDWNLLTNVTVQCTFCYRAHFKTNDHSVLTPGGRRTYLTGSATAKYIFFSKVESQCLHI